MCFPTGVAIFVPVGVEGSGRGLGGVQSGYVPQPSGHLGGDSPQLSTQIPALQVGVAVAPGGVSVGQSEVTEHVLPQTAA